LREDSAHPKHGSSSRRTGINSFAEAYQLDIEFPQFLPKARHVGEGSGQAIKANDNDR
jgi:hypothetical protein